MTDLSDILARLRTVETDLSTVKSTIAGISERLSHMPTTNKMWASMGASVLLLLAGTWTIITFAGSAVVERAVAAALQDQAAKK